VRGVRRRHGYSDDQDELVSAPNPVKPLTLNFVLRHDFTIIPIAVGNFFSKLLFQTLRTTSLEIGSWTDVQTEAEPY
jgi:hypothetical protein